MFYKQNSFAGKLSPTEAQAAYQPQGLGGLKDVSVKGPVIEPPMSSSSSGGIFSAWPNNIRKWQEIFQKPGAPVYLKRGTRDLVVYRGIWGLFTIGSAAAFYCLYGMATGTLKKKERP